MKLRHIRAALLAAGLFATAASPAAAEWKRAETRGFIVYSDGDAGVLRDNALQLELFESSLRFLHGMDPANRAPKQMTIYLVRGHDDLDQVWPGIPESIAGFYRPGDDGIFAMAIRERRDLTTLLHEYAHHFMIGSFGASYPGWFVEGYAEYFMTADLTPRRVMIGNFNQDRANWLQYSRWLPMGDIVTNRPGQYRDPNAVAMYYAQAWLLTHWLMSDTTRMRQMLVYFNKLKTGTPSATALEEAVGMDMAGLERTLKAYSRGRVLMRGFSSEQFPASEVTVTSLGEAESELLLLSLRLSSVRDDEEEEAAVLAQVRNRVSAFPAAPFAQRLLARSEIRLGDREKGMTIAQQLSDADPTDVEALLLLAEGYIAAGDEEDADRSTLMGQARRHLARAYAEDDTDFRTLYMLSVTRRGAPTYPDDNDMETLLAAVELAPQIPTIRFAAAQARAARREHRQAIALLEPMASNPHGDRGGAAARALVESLRTRQGDQNGQDTPSSANETEETVP